MYIISSLLTVIVTVLLNNSVQASVLDVYLPQEILMLKLPKNEAEQWKSIGRHATSLEGLVEYIPLKQTPADWTDLIVVQYINFSNRKLETANPIDEILDLIKTTTINAYPNNKVTWNVIKKAHGEALYEWILHSQSDTTPPQHEIARIFYHMNNVHRIGFTHKNETMSTDDRNKWISLLSQFVSFVSQTDPNFPLEELSLIARPTDSIDYGSNFKDWKVTDNWMFKDNVHSFTIIPPGHNENYVTECLEVTSLRRSLEAEVLKMDQAFLVEKDFIKKKLTKEPEIQILEKSTREIIYTYQYPHDNLIVTEIVRIRATPNVYLSIHYKKGLPKALSQTEILEKKKQIETIKYKAK